MLDRTLTPTLSPIDKIHFVEPKVYNLKNDAKIYFLNEVVDETVRIEFHFLAGSIHGDKNDANFVNSLLFSGTKDKTSSQIHEQLDQLGAYIDHEISMEKAFVSVYCLRENIEKVLLIIHDTITNVTFNQLEIDDAIQEKKQRYLVSLEKVSFLARKLFQQHIFASNELYKRQIEIDDFERINRETLISFHKSNYLNGLVKIVVVSNLEESFIDLLVKLFANWSLEKNIQSETIFFNHAGVFHFEKEKALQTAIRIGIPLFNKKNEDYIEFVFLQTILGDYFGSRLMSNIREDKGYTYGIGCSLVELKNTGYFVIGTEVAKNVCDATLKEIEFEINRLKTELISNDEIELVKNYLIGQLLKSADGPNSMMDLFLNVSEADLSLDFYNEYIHQIKNISASKLKELACKYLDWTKFTIITAGERN